MFRNEYPRYPTIEHIDITSDEKTYKIDLRPFMNPSPYTLQHVSIRPDSVKLINIFSFLGEIIRNT